MNERHPFRVMIVDDSRHAREGMREILADDPHFTVVGEAASAEEGLALMEEVMPDLVLMDIGLPGMGGLDAAKAIKTNYPYVKIVMVTVHDEAALLFEALKKGAQGFLLKNLNPSAWREYLRAVMFDEAPMDPGLARQILREFGGGKGAGPASAASAPETGTVSGAVGPGSGPSSGTSSATPSGPGSGTGFGAVHGTRRDAGKEEEPLREGLTAREKEILQEVAQGKTNREVAAALNLSEHTVKNHLKNILQKLHLHNRVQLTRYAYESGLMDDRTSPGK
ncbi:MAG: DNA-binding response regulator [Paenibacillaceae bacterium ZCTH02-B3]|nr:MAG: DNA-binding response regulator [Paenibacillaceae bacterium ZCTH02-B3]